MRTRVLRQHNDAPTPAIWVVVMSIAASESLWTPLAQTPYLIGKSEEPLPIRRGLSGLRRRTYRLGSQAIISSAFSMSWLHPHQPNSPKCGSLGDTLSC